MSKIKIGILDFGYRKKNTDGIGVLSDIFHYATVADESGFSAYWFGEHHNSGQGWSNPEMLIPLIAGHTNKINVGIAGILLAAHSPYRVALNFKLLDNMFPGRIDLGLANGRLQFNIAQKLQEGTNPDEPVLHKFSRKVDELLSYLENDQALWDKEQLIIPPYGGSIPRVWKLSTSFRELDECLQKKLNICKSTFHTKTTEIPDKKKIMEFKQSYFKVHGVHPKISIAFSGICEKESGSARRSFNLYSQQRLTTAENYIVGSPAYFKERIMEMYESSSVDEFIFYDQGVSPRKRLKALELLAQEFNL